MSIVTCPKCKMRVLPKQDGTCPSCQAFISSGKVGIKQKSSDSYLTRKIQPKTNNKRITKEASAKSNLATRQIHSAPKISNGDITNRDLPKQAVLSFQHFSRQQNIRKSISSMTFCQNCGRIAPTKYVEYYQNIGALVIRFHKNVKGNLCKDCSNNYFWSYTGTTLVLGWWGIISFFVTLFILPNNIIYYLGTLGLRSPSK